MDKIAIVCIGAIISICLFDVSDSLSDSLLQLKLWIAMVLVLAVGIYFGILIYKRRSN